MMHEEILEQKFTGNAAKVSFRGRRFSKVSFGLRVRWESG